MNRHAEKPIKIAHVEESTPSPSDSFPGEVVAAIHCCPACGKVEAEILDSRE
jgi:hypothetical protein